MEALLNLTEPSNNLASLQGFHDTIERHMRSLSAFGKSPESYGMLLTSSILIKLPVETKRHMACEHYETEWSIKDVLAAICKEVQIFEMSHQCNGLGCPRYGTRTGPHGSLLLFLLTRTTQLHACVYIHTNIQYPVHNAVTSLLPLK